MLTSSTSLFRPYIKIDLRGTNLHPRDTCTCCADKISELVGALRALYGLRRVCLPMVEFLSSASTIHLLNLPSDTSIRHLGQALHDLRAISTNHPFAGKCEDVIRKLASEWQINLPGDALGAFPSKPSAHSLRHPESGHSSIAVPRQLSQPVTCSTSSQESHSSGLVNHDSRFGPRDLSQYPRAGSFWSNPGYPVGQYALIDHISMQQASQWHLFPFPTHQMNT